MWATSMPASSAPSFSLATARIALPVSVKVIISQSTNATANTAAKPTNRGTARKVKPKSILLKA